MEGLAKGTHFDEIMKLIEMPEEIRLKMDSEMSELLKNQQYQLLNGVKDVLPILKNEGYKLAIATDNYLKITLRFLEMNNIKKYFDDDLILASDNYAFQKPHIEVIKEIYKRSNTTKGILIGNSSKEIDFAKKAGISVLLLDNFGKIDSNDPTIIYYQKIRQLSENEDYSLIYKAQSWHEIHNVINNILRFSSK
jgi:phosphoglycolate phosphatase-like HAD superfamily hydrolase